MKETGILFACLHRCVNEPDSNEKVGRSPDASWHLRIVYLPSCKVVGEGW